MVNETVKQKIEQRIRDYRQVTSDEIAIDFNMSHSSAYNIGGNGGSAKLVKGHAKKLFSRWHPQACGQAYEVCCEGDYVEK